MALNNGGDLNDEKHFPFLKLPPELRNEIYGLLLTNTTPIKPCTHRRYASDSQKTQTSISASILRVCRQSHYEAMPLLYSLNRFQAHPSLLSGLPFLADPYRPVTSSACSSFIKKYYIAVRLDNDPTWTSEDVARAFSGMDEVELEGWQTSFGECDNSNLMAFSSVRGVDKAKVHGSNLSHTFTRWLEATMESPEEEECIPWQIADWNVWRDGNR
ncbi:hypothetical protein MMC10_003174 [Thelotrema lepadinum]|nr:hypothetical protein [Thelotrema lepadinum]